MFIEARGVSYRYEDLAVLNGVNLSVGEGEVLAVIGPSGCGKSTLLSILGGLLEPSSGEVVVGGKVPEGCLNPLTFVFQDFALLPWRSVAANISLPLEGATVDAQVRAERVEEALQYTGLSDFADAFPRQLSGGMRQRVGLARALAVRPAVLLMDEPLSALDAQTRELLKEDLVRLWQEVGCSVVYVTHNLSESVALADRIAVLGQRPARVLEIVEVPGQREERTRDDPALLGIQQRLWELLRAGARAAESLVR